MVRHNNSLVEIRRKRIEPPERETVAHSLDLVLQAPPLLNNDDAWRVAACSIGQIALRIAAIRTLE